MRTTTAAVTVGEETYVVRAADASVQQTARSQTEAYQEAKRSGGLALPRDDVVVLAGI